MPMEKLTRFFLLIAIPVLVSACSTLPNGRGWGEDVTISPGWERFSQAVKKAALEPETWIPVAGAAILQIDDMDHRLSDWASDHTPLFGSQKDAKDASDLLLNLSEVSYVVTALATPGGKDKTKWAYSKAKGLAVGGASLLVTQHITDLTKDLTERTRPDNSSDRSFPSAHSSNASAAVTLATRNLDSLELTPRTKTLIHMGFKTLAVGTAWARVEGKRHYPSDVLVGYALGHFMSAVFNDTLMGLDHKDNMMLSIEPSRKGLALGLHWFF